MNREIEELGSALCREIAANRLEETEYLQQRCTELHSPETHRELIAILERARRLALVKRSMAAMRLASVQSALQYRSSAVEISSPNVGIATPHNSGPGSSAFICG